MSFKRAVGLGDRSFGAGDVWPGAGDVWPGAGDVWPERRCAVRLFLALALQSVQSGAKCRTSAKNSRTEHRSDRPNVKSSGQHVPSSRQNVGSSKRRETTSNSSWEPPFFAWSRVVWPARSASVTVELRGFARSRQVRPGQLQPAPAKRMGSTGQTGQLQLN